MIQSRCSLRSVWFLLVGAALAVAATGAWSARAAEPKPAPVAPTVTLDDPASRDQDDMCVWVHPTDPARSVVITSDKAAGLVLVYGLDGQAIQKIRSPKPANIDLRYQVPLGDRKVDVMAFNERQESKIRLYTVDASTRQWTRVDDGKIATGPNYGGTLFRSPKTGKLYFLTTSNRCEQYELADDGAGHIGGRLVRKWDTPYGEGAVGDDEAGVVYYADEAGGIWEVGGEPKDPAPGRRIIKTGENGLKGDVEGLAIYKTSKTGGYLLASSQGNSTFKVYDRQSPHKSIGTFRIEGARDTDGIDVVSVPLGSAFAKGLFACHSDRSRRCPVLLTPWDRIAASFTPALEVTPQAGSPRPEGPAGR